MKKFVILSGYPSSGKSTYVKEHLSDYKVVGYDTTLTNLFGNKNTSYDDLPSFREINKSRSREILKSITSNMLDIYMNMNCNVVIDETNLTQKRVNAWLSHTNGHDGYEKILIEFLVPISICRKRNSERIGKSIPDNTYYTHLFCNTELLDYDKFDTIIQINESGVM